MMAQPRPRSSILTGDPPTLGELSQARVGAVRRLIEQVPDAAIRTLETALAHGAKGDSALTLIQTMVGAEVLDRRVRAMAFSPLLPLCAPPRDALQRLAFPRASLAMTWRALKAVAPDEVSQALRAFALMRGDDPLPEVFDALCRRAAAGVLADEEAFRPLIALLKGQGTDTTKQFADSLGLVPLARRALARLPTWIRTLNNDHAAAIRLAFRDAAAIDEDAGPPFMEILFCHIEHPHEILRLISLVMDRPSDRYLAASELASFGERLLGDLERRIEEVRRFDLSRGLEGGVAQAGSVQAATAVIHEFEQWLALNKEGPWGKRLTAHKRALATVVEARMREIEAAVSAALPTQPARSKTSRGAPRLTADPDPAAVLKAQALMAFLCESRTSANYGGFGAVRTKVVETLDPKIDHYAEELLEQLHAGDGGAVDRIRAYLEIAAEFMGLVREPKAAEILRRRTAIA
jgi:hypothetical protein